MTMGTGKCWSYSAGEYGRNKVRAFERERGGPLYIEWTEHGKRWTKGLGHRDQGKAKQKADKFAAGFGALTAGYAAELTLGELFDNFLREVSPQSTHGRQQQHKRTADCWIGVFGKNYKVGKIGEADVRRFIAARKSIGDRRRGAKVYRGVLKPRAWNVDISILKTAIRKAHASGLLQALPPVMSYQMRERSEIRRVMVTQEELDRLMLVAPKVSHLGQLLLTLADQTGHRIGAIRQLRWSDIRFQGDTGQVRWRPELDKIGYDHTTPLSKRATIALRARQVEMMALGSEWVFPAPRNPDEPISSYLVEKWWGRMEKLAILTPKKGRGWHGLRRKFATDHKDLPLAVLARLGGWKDSSTILRSYQHPNYDDLEAAIRRREQTEEERNAEGFAEDAQIAGWIGR